CARPPLREILAREIDHGVHAFEPFDVERLAPHVPRDVGRRLRSAAYNATNLVTVRAEGSNEHRANETAPAGDRVHHSRPWISPLQSPNGQAMRPITLSDSS